MHSTALHTTTPPALASDMAEIHTTTAELCNKYIYLLDSNKIISTRPKFILLFHEFVHENVNVRYVRLTSK